MERFTCPGTKAGGVRRGGDVGGDGREERDDSRRFNAERSGTGIDIEERLGIR